MRTTGSAGMHAVYQRCFLIWELLDWGYIGHAKAAYMDVMKKNYGCISAYPCLSDRGDEK